MPRKAALSRQVGHTCVVHGVGEQVGAFRTQTEPRHRVRVSPHGISELVLAKVPHLSDTTLWLNKGSQDGWSCHFQSVSHR